MLWRLFVKGHKEYEKRYCPNFRSFFELLFGNSTNSANVFGKLLYFYPQKGDMNDPNSYRSICIQNPILIFFYKNSLSKSG